MKKIPPNLCCVLPCYNEELVIDEAYKSLHIKYKRLMASKLISEKSHILFVDDGSSDNTWKMLLHICSQDSQVAALKLSKNEGHQNAVLAGLMTVKNHADVVISLDADLQQDIEKIDEFLAKYNQGCEIVYGVRTSRKVDSIFKKVTALTFYKLLEVFGVNIIKNHADYRLMSAKAIEALSEFKEVNLFLRGVIPLIGFNSGVVYFNVKPRFAGKSKYTVSKMLKLAIDGVTSLSIRPIRMITGVGLLAFGSSIIMILYACLSYLSGSVVEGWTSTLCAVWLIGGIQLLGIGIIGEYVGKIYMETKNRPKYIIEKFIWEEMDKK